eukprot:4949170-Pyramimonas_sp.AAC.1
MLDVLHPFCDSSITNGHSDAQRVTVSLATPPRSTPASMSVSRHLPITAAAPLAPRPQEMPPLQMKG